MWAPLGKGLRTPAVRLNALTRLLWRVHRRLYGRLGGRLGVRAFGHGVLLLETTGRRTGRRWTVPLFYLDHDRGYAVIASYVGQHRHPGWAHNLRADPTASLTVGKVRSPAAARELTGPDRDAVAALFEAKDKAYVTYRGRTSRVFPIFVLEPLPDG